MNDFPPILSDSEFLHPLKRRRAGGGPCYAMYSSWVGGIVTDPALMLVPVDDHGVHRGDGVFETIKCVRGALYNLRAHLDRLERSAGVIDLALPECRDGLTDRLVETVHAGGHRDCVVRMIVTRGPCSLVVNPYDCPEPQLYILAAGLPAPFMESHPGGARAGLSAIPARSAPLARIKSINYLPNVLMKKEAVDRDLDFVLALDAEGYVSEGSIENVALIDAEGRLVTPSGDRFLEGTTVGRVLELADTHGGGEITGRDTRRLTPDDLYKAREVLMTGTTIDVSAVVEFEGRPVGNGKPGPGYKRLNTLLRRDILENPAMRTPVFPAA